MILLDLISKLWTLYSILLIFSSFEPNESQRSPWQKSDCLIITKLVQFLFLQKSFYETTKRRLKNEKKRCIKSIFCDHNTKNSRNNQKLDEKDQNTWIWTTGMGNFKTTIKNKQWKLSWILKATEYVQSYIQRQIHSLKFFLKQQKSNSTENALDIQTELLA